MKILQKCKEAMTRDGNKGKVIVVEKVLVDENINDYDQEDDVSSTQTKLYSDMTMRTTLFSGKERTKKMGKRFSDAGFKTYELNPVLGVRFVFLKLLIRD